jgi:hypothetical protein
MLGSLLLEGVSIADAGRVFEQHRRPRVEWVRTHTDRQARILNLTYWLRNLTARAFGKRLWMQSFSPLRDSYLPVPLVGYSASG